MKKNNSGFSLVELIIVIAIMAVLVGVLAPQFIKFVEKSRESTDLQTIAEAKTAVETYVADKGKSGTFTVETTGTTAGSDIKVTGTTGDGDLAIYGIPSAAKVGQLKSGEWSGKIVWTYSDYSWKITTPAPTAKYLSADGTEKDS